MMSTTTMRIARISATVENAEDEILECLLYDVVVILTGMFSRNHIEQVRKENC